MTVTYRRNKSFRVLQMELSLFDAYDTPCMKFSIDFYINELITNNFGEKDVNIDIIDYSLTPVNSKILLLVTVAIEDNTLEY